MEEKKKLIEVNVNMGNGKMEKLTLYEGRKIDEEVEKFAAKNSKSDMRDVVDIRKAALKKLCASVKQNIKL